MTVTSPHIYYPTVGTLASPVVSTTAYDLRKVTGWSKSPNPKAPSPPYGPVPPSGGQFPSDYTGDLAQVRFIAQEAVIWFALPEFETAIQASLNAEASAGD